MKRYYACKQFFVKKIINALLYTTVRFFQDCLSSWSELQGKNFKNGLASHHHPIYYYVVYLYIVVYNTTTIIMLLFLYIIFQV